MIFEQLPQIIYRFINKLGLAVGIIYLVLGVAFLLSGILLIRKLWKYYKGFYDSVRCTIWLSTILLSLSLLMRGIINMIRFLNLTLIDEEIEESDKDNTLFSPLYDAFMFTFTDMIPISAQLLSMVFGLIRSQNIKKQRKYHHLKSMVNYSGDLAAQNTDENDNNSAKRKLNYLNNQYLVLDQKNDKGGDDRLHSEVNDSFLSISSCSFFDPPVEDYYSKNNYLNIGKNQGNIGLGMRQNNTTKQNNNDFSRFDSHISNFGEGNAENLKNKKSGYFKSRKESLFRLFKRNNTIDSEGDILETR